MKHECIFKETIPRIEKKLDDALKFKYLLTGGSIVVMFICGIIWKLLDLFI